MLKLQQIRSVLPQIDRYVKKDDVPRFARLAVRYVKDCYQTLLERAKTFAGRPRRREEEARGEATTTTETDTTPNNDISSAYTVDSPHMFYFHLGLPFLR